MMIYMTYSTTSADAPPSIQQTIIVLMQNKTLLLIMYQELMLMSFRFD